MWWILTSILRKNRSSRGNVINIRKQIKTPDILELLRKQGLIYWITDKQTMHVSSQRCRNLTESIGNKFIKLVSYISEPTKNYGFERFSGSSLQTKGDIFNFNEKRITYLIAYDCKIKRILISLSSAGALLFTGVRQTGIIGPFTNHDTPERWKCCVTKKGLCCL